MGMPETPSAHPEPQPAEGFGLLLVCAVLFFGGGRLLHAAGILDAPAAAALQVAALALPAILWARVRRVADLAFPGGVPTGKMWGEALIWGGLGSGSAFCLALLASRWFESGGEEDLLVELVRGYPPRWQFLLFALIPAVSEELLFRGAFLSCLARWRLPAAAGACGILFGLFHGSAARFLPSAALGFFLAVLVLRTRNLWLAALVHGVHNAAVLRIIGAVSDGTG